MSKLASEIEALEAEDARLSAATAHRTKQFRLLMHLIADLEQTLKSDESAEAADGAGGAAAAASPVSSSGGSPAAKKRRTDSG